MKRLSIIIAFILGAVSAGLIYYIFKLYFDFKEDMDIIDEIEAEERR